MSIFSNDAKYSSKFIMSQENLLLIKDGLVDDATNPPTTTRFIKVKVAPNLVGIGQMKERNAQVLKFANAGNIYMNASIKDNDIGGDFIDVWSRELTLDVQAVNKVTPGSLDPSIKHIYDFSEFQRKVLYLSNFGNTISPFNRYPNALNNTLFKQPSIIQVPKFMPAYIGLLLSLDITFDANNKLIPSQQYTDLLNFFNNSIYSGQLLFADIYDANLYLSEKDKRKFINEYNKFVIPFSQLDIYIKSIQTDIAGKSPVEQIDYCKDKLKNDIVYKTLLNQQYLLNYNDYTFKLGTQTYDKYDFNISWGTNDRIAISNKFFIKFFTTLTSSLEKSKADIKKSEDSFKKSVGDEDIVTQTYYSFKNLNDKWIAGMDKTIVGYPFNESGKHLIDSFAFVDRAMNPIGDTILNPESLLQMFDDPNISIFTVLSTLLSQNGFEFFPLQNFMSHTPSEWRNAFLIDNNTIRSQSPAFVCMYIGGSSSYPTGMELYRNQFKDDGVTDLETDDGLLDFNMSGCDENDYTKDNQMNVESNFKPNYSQVRAFRVKFGEQNQSMFNDYKIDSKEYPETNESIQILARIAGDEGQQAPIPKGQNLYNLYENRSYKATISGLGNVMIQPTQYFQLENVPLFNGAYIILSVEHNIEPNKMITSFSGTKILKYPVPRVLNAASIVGFDGASTSNTNTGDGNNNTSGGSTSGANGCDVKDQAKYNSMYSFKFDKYVKMSAAGEAYIRKCVTDEKKKINGIVAVVNTTGDVAGIGKNTTLTESNYSDALIALINHYSSSYGLDANVVAALIFTESRYVLNADSGFAIGISQMDTGTIHDVIIINKYNVEPKISDDFISKITQGINNPKNVDELRNQTDILKRNVFKNPEVMIQGACRFLKILSEKCNNLVSSTCYSYNSGIGRVRKTYLDVMKDSENLEESLNFVLKIFATLGDKNNNIPNTQKVKSVSFGYDDILFEAEDIDTYPNDNYKCFNATVASSNAYSSPTDFKVGGFTNPLGEYIPSISPLKVVKFTSDYGWRGSNGDDWHDGVDMSAVNGTPVFATATGVVKFAGKESGTGYGGYGLAIGILHGDDLTTVYGHLSSINVKVGEFVKIGQYIGDTGDSDTKGSFHLHYEIRKGGTQPTDSINPYSYLPNDAKQLLAKYTAKNPLNANIGRV